MNKGALSVRRRGRVHGSVLARVFAGGISDIAGWRGVLFVPPR
jgi:hypothetical protein